MSKYIVILVKLYIVTMGTVLLQGFTQGSHKYPAISLLKLDRASHFSALGPHSAGSDFLLATF